MKAYPPDDERFVKRQTSVKDWPVFSDKGGAISKRYTDGSIILKNSNRSVP